MIEPIVTLLNAVNEETYGKLIDGNVIAYSKKIIAKATIISIYNTGVLVAFIAYYDNDPNNENAFLTMLVVDKLFRNMDYGQVLLESAMSALRKKKFKQMTLEVLKDNVSAVSLYEKNGFRVVHKTLARYTMNLSL